MSRYLVLIIISSLGLQGCATLSQDECKSADWYTIGYEDGLRGHTPVRISDHRKACAGHGVSPDLARYTLGREAGLEWYCQPRNGFRFGLKGQAYTGVCPAPSEPAFLQAWSAGKEIHTAEYEVRRLDRILGVNQDQLDSLIDDRELTESAISRERAHLLALRQNARHWESAEQTSRR